MLPTNFECGHCHQLMAVGEEFLGKQVRCPHCHQVVVAPAPTSPAAAPPTVEISSGPMFTVPPVEERESIFGSAEPAGDDLFGGPAGPQVEMPPQPEWMQPTVQMTPPPAPAPAAEVALTAPTPAGDATLTQVPDMQLAPAGGSGEALTETLAPPVSDWMGAPVGADTAPGVEPESLMTAPPRSVTPRGKPSMWPIVLTMSLISYSILATIAVVILYMRQQEANAVNPLEYLRDEGENKGVRDKKQSVFYERPRPETPLPGKLRVALGETIQIGDLEIHPQKVERTRLFYRTKGDLQQGQKDSLVLHLHLKNNSRDSKFYPTDPYFDRRCTATEGKKTYTFLEVGERKFYGGPEKITAGETIDGRQYRELGPGEEMDTIVCTAENDDAGKALEGYDGPMLWRVQIRRGLVQLGDRAVSATAVVGVEFAKKDIQAGKPEEKRRS